MNAKIVDQILNYEYDSLDDANFYCGELRWFGLKGRVLSYTKSSKLGTWRIYRVELAK